MSNLLPPPPYFMQDPHLVDTSSYFDCYQQHQHLQYSTISSVSTSKIPSTTSLLPSHFASSGAVQPYELSSSSSHILTPPSIIPTPPPSITSPSLSTFGFPMGDYNLDQVFKFKFLTFLVNYQFQMEAICTSLFQARDGERLVAFFNQLKTVYGSNALDHFGSEAIVVGEESPVKMELRVDDLYAYTYALYHSNDFERLFHLLSTRHFQQIYFTDLQEIWHYARYKESQLKRGKELNPVEKYRLRRKFPPPKTIWDGEETVYSFKDSSRKYLKKFFQDVTQYPSQEQKRDISRVTKLKVVQVRLIDFDIRISPIFFQISNWFKNRRQRDKTDQSDRSPQSSSSSTNGGSDFPPLINSQSFNLAPFNMQMNVFFDS
ncbi:CRE-UNC-39 protein [Caenorhabditis remanei]|uniref:CRE-UNC-39 protein n=1 Tax=Caenorhabditis remanei TaxID=31234 RepID=E3LTK7_CAERE|nr:CRE-UNC-39 protein [Caenorhabditis remanei]